MVHAAGYQYNIKYVNEQLSELPPGPATTCGCSIVSAEVRNERSGQAQSVGSVSS